MPVVHEDTATAVAATPDTTQAAAASAQPHVLPLADIIYEPLLDSHPVPQPDIHAQRPPLDPAERVAAQLEQANKATDAFVAANFSASKLQEFLDLLKGFPAGTCYTPSSYNASKLVDNVTDAHLGPDFESIDIRPMLGLTPAMHPQPILVSVRTNPLDIIQALIAS